MTNFMSDNGGEFGITSHQREQAGSYDHLSSRQGKRVRSGVDEDGKLPQDVGPLDSGGDSPPNPPDFRVCCRIAGDPMAALQLVKGERSLCASADAGRIKSCLRPVSGTVEQAVTSNKARILAARRESLHPKVLRSSTDLTLSLHLRLVPATRDLAICELRYCAYEGSNQVDEAETSKDGDAQ